MASDQARSVGDQPSKQRSGLGWLSHFGRTQQPATVVINPVTDAEFEAHVKSLLPEVVTPESLEEALRPQYPRVVVHRRELSSEPITMWYVYRDGRWQR